MKNLFESKACGCSIDPCLHNMKDQGQQDQSVVIRNNQVKMFLDFFSQNTFSGELKITFNNSMQRGQFLNYLHSVPEKRVNDDFETSFVNFQHEEEDENPELVQPQRTMINTGLKKTQELILFYPYNYIMRIVEFFKHSLAYAQNYQVELQMGRNQKVMMISDSQKNMDQVQQYLTNVIKNCEHVEMKKQRWEAIAINNTRSIINKLNAEKIGFTKMEDNHDFFKLFFFWKSKNGQIPEIIQYIQNSTFVSIKMIKNKKIQKANLNQDQNKLMNVFAEIKTKLFQKNFKPQNMQNMNFEMKIDDKNQIFNRFIYHYLNPKSENTKSTILNQGLDMFKINLDSQINTIVYFGLVVKDQEFNPKKSQFLEFSNVEKIGNLNIIGFCFDLRGFSHNQSIFGFLNQLEICGIIFDNFKWKLNYDNIQEMKSFNLKNIKFVSENQQNIQLHGLISNETNQSDFWKRIIFYIMDMSDKNNKANKANNMFEFNNYNKQNRNENNNFEGQTQQKDEFMQDSPQNIHQQRSYIDNRSDHSNQTENKNKRAFETPQFSFESPQFSDKFQTNYQEKSQDKYQEKQPTFEKDQRDEKKQFYDNLFEQVDNFETQGQELQSPHLKYCNKQDQERIQLQLRNISKRYQVVEIFKNFNQNLFETYNDLKEKHDILDVMEKQLYTFSNEFKQIVENGFLKGQKFYQNLENQIPKLKDHNYIFICHILFNDKLIDRHQDSFVLKQDKIAFPTYVIKLDKKR